MDTLDFFFQTMKTLITTVITVKTTIPIVDSVILSFCAESLGLEGDEGFGSEVDVMIS